MVAELPGSGGPNADGADVKRAAAKNGFPERMLQRAARKVGVVYGRTGFGKDTRVTWSLPTQVAATVATGEKEEHLRRSNSHDKRLTVSRLCRN
jgi:hypothetical protein